MDRWTEAAETRYPTDVIRFIMEAVRDEDKMTYKAAVFGRPRASIMRALPPDESGDYDPKERAREEVLIQNPLGSGEETKNRGLNRDSRL